MYHRIRRNHQGLIVGAPAPFSAHGRTVRTITRQRRAATGMTRTAHVCGHIGRMSQDALALSVHGTLDRLRFGRFLDVERAEYGLRLSERGVRRLRAARRRAEQRGWQYQPRPDLVQRADPAVTLPEDVVEALRIAARRPGGEAAYRALCRYGYAT